MHVSAVGEIAKRLKVEQGLSTSQAYKVARRESLKSEPPLQEGFSKKDGILEALDRINSRPGTSLSRLIEMLKAMRVQTNIQEVTSLVWDLQKLQFVAFKEGHQRSGSTMEHIRITRAGRAQAKLHRDIAAGFPPGTELPAAGAEYAGPKMKPGSSRRSRAVGRDMTQAINHGTKAKGGPIEHINPPSSTLSQDILPPIVIDIAKIGDPLAQNLKAPLTDEEFIGVVSPVEFPYLFSLLERREEKVMAQQKAAKLVMAAESIVEVDSEGAELLMARAAEIEGPSMTKEEVETLRFLDQCAGIPEAFRINLS